MSPLAAAASIHARGPGDLAHPPALEVAECLHELVVGIHHEWPVVLNPLAQRLAREQQRPRLAAPQPDRVAGPQHGELPLRDLAITYPRRSLENIGDRILVACERDRHVRP